MKKKIYISAIIILLSMSDLIAQNIDGIWFSSYSIEINKSQYRTDTIFNSSFLLLDFIDSKNVIFKTYKDSIEKLEYKRIKNEINIKINKENIEGLITDNKIIFTVIIDSITTKKILMERFQSSQLTFSQIPDSAYFNNSNWIIKSDLASIDNDTNLDFLDNEEVIITNVIRENGCTNLGNYGVDSYKNHSFILVFDRNNLIQNIYHFYNFGNSTFFAENFFFNDIIFNKTPIYNKLKFTKENILNYNQLNSIKERLIGKWKATNKPIPQPLFSKYDSLKKQNFEIYFLDNNTFKIKESGILIKDQTDIPKELIFTGTWQLSKTGKYIKLISNIRWQDTYITISKLTENSLHIYYEIKALDGNMIKQQKIELKK